MRKFFWGLGFFLAASTAVFLAPKLIDWNQFKGEIQDQVRSATGRDVYINGDIFITILPFPVLVANDVSLDNVNGAKTKSLLQLSSLEVSIALAPLLGGQVKVKRIKLVDPVIELEVLSDGRQNWMVETGKIKSGASSAKGALATISNSENERTSITKSKSRPSALMPLVALDSLSIENGTVTYRDTIDGTFEKIEGFDANFSAASTKGPFEVSGELMARGLPVTFNLNAGEIIQGRTMAFALKAATAPGDLKMFLSGTLVGIGDVPRVKGSIKGEAKSFAAFIKTVKGASFSGPLDQAFSFEANIAAWSGGAVIKGLELRFGNAKASGSINVKVGKTLSVAVRLGTGRIDLDSLLSTQGTPVPSVPKKLSGGGSGVSLLLGDETASKLKSKDGFFIPKSIQASLTLTAEVIIFRNKAIRNGRVNAELSNGEITLSQVSAQFPGGSDMALFGFVTLVNDDLRFEGKLESTVNDLRGVLDWLGQNIDGVAKDRLRKLTLVTRVFATPDQIKLANLKLRFDSSRLTGGLTVALRKRPSFGANITVNKINLDAYLPKQKKKKIKKKAVFNSANIKDRVKASPAISKKKNFFQALSLLNEMDANLSIMVKSLTLRDGVIKNAVFDGTLYNGNLDIRRFSADRVSGSTVFAKGKISNFGEVPKVVALSFKAKTKDVNGLLRFAGISAVPAIKSLGAVKAYGQIDGPILAPTVNINFAGADAQIKVFGQLEGLSLVPAVKKLMIQVKVKDTTKLLKLAGIKSVSVQQLGAVTVDGEIDGSLLASKLAFDVKILGGGVAVSGKINTLPIGDLFDLSVRLRHPDVGGLLRSIGGYNPAGSVGRLDVQGRLLGGLKGVSLKGITARVGNVDLRGDMAIGLGSLRPQINANFTGGNIVIDPFLPANRITSYWPGLKIRSVATRKKFSGWSTDPIDLSGLAEIDAQVILKSPSVKYDRYNLQNADLSISLGQGRLRADKITGRIFGGSLRATAATTIASLPRIETAVVLKDIEIAEATRVLTGASIAGGKMGLEVSLNSVGGSVSDLISGLGGNGSVQLNGIKVQKGGAGTMLAGALGLASAMNQISGLFSVGGSSAGRVDLSGSFAVLNGIATSSDIRILSGLGEGAASGVVDLPRWGIDFKGNVKLGESILANLVSRGGQSNLSPIVPFAIYGQLDSPSIKMDTSKITGGALRIPGAEKLLKKLPKGVGSVLQGILSGKSNQKRKAPDAGNKSPKLESQQQQKKIDPVDFIKEIFRRR